MLSPPASDSAMSSERIAEQVVSRSRTPAVSFLQTIADTATT